MGYVLELSSYLLPPSLPPSLTQGTVECWDPRSQSRVGELSLAMSGVQFSERYRLSIVMVTHS